MNLRGICYYLGLFSFPIGVLAFFNILYSSYFDYLLNLNSYIITLIASIFNGLFLLFIGKKGEKKLDFYEQLILIVLTYFLISVFISIPYFFSNYNINLINSLFESFSGITGTGFSIFNNIKYIDPTLIIWRSSSQWIGGLYFLLFLFIFFSNSNFNFKLINLVNTSNGNLNSEINIKRTTINIFLIYTLLTLLLFILLSSSGVRLFNSFNISMTLISAGGFLPTNTLNQIINTNYQKILLLISFLISTLNIVFIYNLFFKKNIVKVHYEDISIFITILAFSIILLITFSEFNFIECFINVLSSVSTSGITLSEPNKNISLYFLFLAIMGGSIISNTSGIKFLRIYILLKASLIEILSLVKPKNVVNQNILYSENKINNENIKFSFLIFISFFISLFLLTGVLLLDNINFESAFKLSILTLTNTTDSNLHSLSIVNFNSLLTSSKIFLILFMIIGKIELISIFLIFRRIFIKN